MNKTAIKAIVSSSMPLSVEDGYTARKRTVPGTFHIGVLSGNRLNSGTLRSQFIFFESESDWLNNDASAKNALHTAGIFAISRRRWEADIRIGSAER